MTTELVYNDLLAKASKTLSISDSSKRERILKLARDLENMGFPTHKICKQIRQDLAPQIEHGMISPGYIWRVLPDKYKTTPKVKAQERRWRIKIENHQDRIIKQIRLIDDPVVLNMILEIVKKKINK